MMDSISPDAARQSSGSLGSTFLLWLIWILWLPLFIPALIDLFQRHRSPLWVATSLLAAAAFFAMYLWSVMALRPQPYCLCASGLSIGDGALGADHKSVCARGHAHLYERL